MDLRHARADDAFFEHHVALLEMVDGMAAPRRLAHHGEGRILVDLESGQRVGEKGDFHGASIRGNALILARIAETRGRGPGPTPSIHT